MSEKEVNTKELLKYIKKFQNLVSINVENSLKKKFNKVNTEGIQFQKTVENRVDDYIQLFRRLVFEKYPLNEEGKETVVKEIHKHFSGVKREIIIPFITFWERWVKAKELLTNDDRLKSFLKSVEINRKKERSQVNTTYQMKPQNFGNLETNETFKECSFRELEINKINVGKRISINVIHEGHKIVGRIVLCEDSSGKYVQVSLYNLSKFEERMIKVGTKISISDPYLKVSLDGETTIRVDYPESLIITAPKNIDLKALSEMAFQCVEERDYVSALQFYDKILEKSDKIEFLNRRIECFVNLRNYTRSLMECRKILLSKIGNSKTKFYEVLSLVELGKSEEVNKKMEEYRQVFSEGEFQKLLNTKIDIYSQQRKGVYDMENIIENVDSPVTDFDGPFVVKEAEGKGRGCFATRKIEGGGVVLVSKALTYVVNDDRDGSKGIVEFDYVSGVNQTDRVRLKHKIIELIKVNPELKKEFLYLSDGKVLPEEGTRELSAILINDILSTNVFNITSHPFRSRPRSEGSGVFIKPSFFNHSCLANCSWYTVKDVLFIVANRMIEKGEELSFSYFSLDKAMEEKRDWFEKKGFVCDCKLCKGEYDIKDKQFHSVMKRKNIDKDKFKVKNNLKALLSLKRKIGQNPLLLKAYRVLLKSIFVSQKKVDENTAKVFLEEIVGLYVEFPHTYFEEFFHSMLWLLGFIRDKKIKVELLGKLWNGFKLRFGTFTKMIFEKFVGDIKYYEKVESYSILNRMIICNSCKTYPSEGKKDFKRCGGCKKVYYCDIKCQKRDWSNHKTNCKLKGH